MQEINQETVQKQNPQDNTPKWKIRLLYLFALGTCSTAIAAAFGLFGDAPGQCIKNTSYTRNYIKRLDADFADFLRRNEYYRNPRYNG